jgi:uncharacterized phage protein (TIGR02220 family)
MPFVKLDVKILDSSLWDDRDQREAFIVLLLLGEPYEVRESSRVTIVTQRVTRDGVLPEGWYGVAKVTTSGLARRIGIGKPEVEAALDKLQQPDPDSRDSSFEGRRILKIEDGYIILNFMKYREFDHTASERAKRYRDRKKIKDASRVTTVTVTRDVTQAEADVEVEDHSSLPLHTNTSLEIDPRQAENVTRDERDVTRDDTMEVPLPEDPDEEDSASLLVLRESLAKTGGSASAGARKAKLKSEATELLEFLNWRVAKNFKPVEATLKPIINRLAEGADIATCKAIIVRRWRLWSTDEKMQEYLRPATIFAKQNFWNYHGELPREEVADTQPAFDLGALAR